MEQRGGGPRALGGLAIVLASSTGLALLVRWEVGRDGAVARAAMMSIGLIGVVTGIGVLAWAIARPAHEVASPLHAWTAQKSWLVGLGWMALVVPLALAIQLPDLWIGALVPVAFLVAIVVHECGHAAAALLLGLRITTIQIGPLVFDREKKRVLLEGASDAGGAVRASDAPGSRIRSAILVAAGPLANVMSGVASLVASRAPSSFVFAWASLITTLVSLSPATSVRGGLKSDGRALADILFRWRSMTTERQILAEVLRGIRPRDWSVRLQQCLANVDRPGTLLSLLTFTRAMDERAQDVAGRLLADALGEGELAPDAAIDWFVQGAMFEALVRDDAAGAAKLLERAVAAPTHEPGYELLAKAAVLAVSGKPHEARAARAAWLDHVARSGQPNLKRGGNEWALDELALRLDSPAA